jgi:hypothetical protein
MKKDEERLPLWAIREIRALSRRTGISFQKLLGAVLGFGIYNAKEQLEPTANLLESAEQMARSSIEPAAQPEPVQNDVILELSDITPAEEGAIDRSDNLAALAAGLSGYAHADPVTARHLDAGERRGEPEENGEDSDYVAALSGD